MTHETSLDIAQNKAFREMLGLRDSKLDLKRPIVLMLPAGGESDTKPKKELFEVIKAFNSDNVPSLDEIENHGDFLIQKKYSGVTMAVTFPDGSISDGLGYHALTSSIQSRYPLNEFYKTLTGHAARAERLPVFTAEEFQKDWDHTTAATKKPLKHTNG